MIEFDEKTHEYKLDGVVVPSVTQITRFLHYDEAQNANKWLRDEAARRGSAIHAATVLMDYGEDIPDDFPEEWRGYIKAYERFRRDFPQLEYRGIEEIIYSDGCNFYCESYAGTVDRWGIQRNAGEETRCPVPFVLDIKTGSKINHAGVIAQLQGYEYILFDSKPEFKQFYDECDFENFAAMLCLQLCKDGTYKLYDESFDEDLFEICINMNKAAKKKGKKI